MLRTHEGTPVGARVFGYRGRPAGTTMSTRRRTILHTTMLRSISVLLVFVVSCATEASPPAAVEEPVSTADEEPAAAEPVTEAPAEAIPRVDPERAREVLFPDGLPADLDCPSGVDHVRCLIAASYADDESSRELALALFDESGDVAGVEREFEMDGGFRGLIHIVPERPVGRYRHHLTWALAAQRDITSFVDTLQEHTPSPIAYDHAPLVWRFFRSVDRTTPSAYAGGGEIAYNVSGSLNKSADAVRELIVHEAFHLNDETHGHWSRPALGEIVDGIVAECGTEVSCLTPYAPNKTRVIGGTYYAFQPDNGDIAREYAAELAVRYVSEQRAKLAGRALERRAFKCGPEVNARAYRALADEFFGGVDLVPDCP